MKLSSQTPFLGWDEWAPRSLILGFFAAAILFNLCLAIQVLTVGLAYFYDSHWWTVHVWLVRAYGGLSLLIAAIAWYFSLPHRVKALALSLPILLGLQFLTIHLQTPVPLAVLHPLIGFSLFSASTTLVHRVGNLLAAAQDPPSLLSPPAIDLGEDR